MSDPKLHPYTVRLDVPNGPPVLALVKASNPARARNHVLEPLVSVHRTSTDDLIALLQSGIAIETAREDVPSNQLGLPLAP